MMQNLMCTLYSHTLFTHSIHALFHLKRSEIWHRWRSHKNLGVLYKAGPLRFWSYFTLGWLVGCFVCSFGLTNCTFAAPLVFYILLDFCIPLADSGGWILTQRMILYQKMSIISRKMYREPPAVVGNRVKPPERYPRDLGDGTFPHFRNSQVRLGAF